jgi:glucokinase
MSAFALTIGVDLGGTNVRAAAVRDGRIVATNARAISAHAAQEIVMAEVIATIESVLTSEVSAIGIGVPSLVDRREGIVHRVENIPSWERVPLKAILEARFKIPVQVNNDANCFALGEHRFGAGREVKDMVGMVMGTGLGAGVIANGHLVSGANCGAGEIGSFAYQAHTLEHFCSGQFFTREYGIDGATLNAAADAGDAKAKESFTRYGAHLGAAVIMVLQAYDPALIVLGGSVAKAHAHFSAEMSRVVQSFPYPHVVERLKIVTSNLPHAALLGAAMLCDDDQTPCN